MNALSCQAAGLLLLLVGVYIWVLIAYAVLSWIPDLRYRIGRYLDPFVLPFLAPLRRVIPPVGGFDISFIVLILIIELLVRPLLMRLAFSVCGY